MTPSTADGLVYEQVGRGPAVLLIHAGIGDRFMWEPQWASWGERFHLIRYDQRGFGESADPVAPYLLHEDALSVLRAAGVDRAAVVGCSLGARAAIDLALESPEAVSALVSVCGSASGAEWGPELRALAEKADAAFETDGAAAANEVELRIWVDGTRPRGSAPAAVREAIAPVNLGLLEREAGFAGRPVAPDPPATGRLARLQPPVLAVSAEHDQPWMRAQAGELAAAAPHAEQVEIAGAAHLPSLERPVEFERAVLPFLERYA